MDYHIYHTDSPPTPEQEEEIRSQLVIITSDRDQAYQNGLHYGRRLGIGIGISLGAFLIMVLRLILLAFGV